MLSEKFFELYRNVLRAVGILSLLLLLFSGMAFLKEQGGLQSVILDILCEREPASAELSDLFCAKSPPQSEVLCCSPDEELILGG